MVQYYRLGLQSVEESYRQSWVLHRYLSAAKGEVGEAGHMGVLGLGIVWFSGVLGRCVRCSVTFKGPKVLEQHVLLL